jgi:predicted lipoprotein
MTEDGRYERFAFFPDVHGTGARQLRRFLADENPALLETGALAEQSAAVQGLPAVESLLYSGSKALLKTEEPGPYRCQLALRVAGNMRTIAHDTLLRWTEPGGWAELLKTPGARNSVYRTDTEAMTEVLKAILTGLEQLRDHRLLPALGDTPEEAKASRAPYNASALALPYIAASVDALERFVGVSGILGLVPEENKWIVGSAAFEFGNLKRALGEAGPDLEAALADPARREKLVYAAIVLASLRNLFQDRLGPAAGISGGFNSLDGD